MPYIATFPDGSVPEIGATMFFGVSFNEHMDGEYWQAAQTLISEYELKTTFIVADRPYGTTQFVRQTLNPKKTQHPLAHYEQKAIDAGTDWIRTSGATSYKRYDTIVYQPGSNELKDEFNDFKEQIQEQYEIDVDFKSAVDDRLTNYLIKQKTREEASVDVTTDAKLMARAYILNELAYLMTALEEHKKVHNRYPDYWCYPGEAHQPFELLLEDIRKQDIGLVKQIEISVLKTSPKAHRTPSKKRYSGELPPRTSPEKPPARRSISDPQESPKSSPERISEKETDIVELARIISSLQPEASSPFIMATITVAQSVANQQASNPELSEDNVLQHNEFRDFGENSKANAAKVVMKILPMIRGLAINFAVDLVGHITRHIERLQIQATANTPNGIHPAISNIDTQEPLNSSSPTPPPLPPSPPLTPSIMSPPPGSPTPDSPTP